MRALIGKNQPVPDGIDVVGVGPVSGDGLLVVEDMRVAVEPDRLNGTPGLSSVGGLADENRIGEIARVVECERDLVGVAIGPETHPWVSRPFEVTSRPSRGTIAAGELRPLRQRELSPGRAAVVRQTHALAAGPTVGEPVLLVDPDHPVGIRGIDVDPRFHLGSDVQRPGLWRAMAVRGKRAWSARLAGRCDRRACPRSSSKDQQSCGTQDNAPHETPLPQAER